MCVSLSLSRTSVPNAALCSLLAEAKESERIQNSIISNRMHFEIEFIWMENRIPGTSNQRIRQRNTHSTRMSSTVREFRRQHSDRELHLHFPFRWFTCSREIRQRNLFNFLHLKNRIQIRTQFVIYHKASVPFSIVLTSATTANAGSRNGIHIRIDWIRYAFARTLYRFFWIQRDIVKWF